MQPDKKLSNSLLAILGLLVALGVLIAWDAMSRYATAIAAMYATAAILAAAAWLSLLLVRVAYGVRRSRREHTLDEAEAKARHITIATETGLQQAEAMARARILSADARKAEREAELHIITAKRDEQVLISDSDPTKKYMAAHLQMSGQVNNTHVAATPEQIEAYTKWHTPRGGGENTVPMIQEPAPTTLPLLPALTDCDNILIVGGKGSGKTTLLQWLEAEHMQRGKTIVLDSHAEPGQWFSQVIGAGRKYTKIKNAMIALIKRMDERHDRRAKGEKRFAPICTIVDEFTLLPGYLKEAGYKVKSYSFPMLTEGRKVEMSCLWGIHSDRVKATGFEGMGDLRECFDAVVRLKHVKGDYYALVDFGEGKETTRYIPPGPFFVQPRQATEDLLTVDNEPEPKPEPDRAEQIRTMYNNGNGMTKTEIAKSFGYNSNEGAIFYHIKNALGETTTTTTEQRNDP